jgi:lipid-binding SYLF domain-containing protein
MYYLPTITEQLDGQDGQMQSLWKKVIMHWRSELMTLVFLLFMSAAALVGKEKAEALQRLDEAAAVFQEIMATPDRSIPQDLLDKAQCIVIVPGLKKGAFIVGGKYGKGYISCRKKGAGWSAPGTVRVEGGSVGLQIGGSASDVIMLVMNERGVNKLLSSKFTLGGEGAVAAGPVGREATAQTDALMHAEILSWSRTQGLFAGISLQGATLRQDLNDNAVIYGKKITNKDIVQSSMPVPNAAHGLISQLNKYSATKNSN